MSIRNVSRSLFYLANPIISFSNREKLEGFAIRAFSSLSLNSYLNRTAKPTKFAGVEALKLKQAEHLKKLEGLASKGLWEHLQKETLHPDSGFDWFMFPIDRSSKGQGLLYTVDNEAIAKLLKDEKFVNNYRQGVALIAKSWGWDLTNRVDHTNAACRWVGYDVRLGKMLHSLQLFKQKDLHENLVYFVDKHKLRPSLESWILPYLA